VTTGGVHIVQGQHHETIALKADKANEGYSVPVWEDTRQAAIFRGGKIAALMENARRGCAAGDPEPRPPGGQLPPTW